MLTLSYGFQKPESGNNGAAFFPALESNIQQLNDHTHNGSNSALLTASSSTAVSQSILAASWASLGSGKYSQTVTMPGVITFDTHNIQLRNTSTGEIMLLSVTKASANTYTVYINDNTIALTAIYT